VVKEIVGLRYIVFKLRFICITTFFADGIIFMLTAVFFEIEQSDIEGSFVYEIAVVEFSSISSISVDNSKSSTEGINICY
jgi:hypothetical protein